MASSPESLNLSEIRQMRSEDMAQVYELELRAYPFPWSEQIFKDCLQSGFLAWVMLDENGICGYSLVSLGAGESHLLNLCVDPDRQRKGLGSEFLDWLILEVQRRNAEIMFLEVRPSNEAAIALYESRGFNQIGLRPGYYRMGKLREDAIVMAKQL